MADYRKIARQKARKYGLDPHIFERQIEAESSFRNLGANSAGAIGIAQIIGSTAKSWGVNPRDPVASLDAAAKHMAQYVKKYGSYEKALRAYNAGPGAIEKSRGYAETNAYVAKILHGRDPGKLGSPSGGGGGGGSPQREAIVNLTRRGDPSAALEQARKLTVLQQHLGKGSALVRNGLLGTLIAQANQSAQDALDSTTQTTLRSGGEPASGPSGGDRQVQGSKTIKTTYGGVTENIKVGQVPGLDKARNAPNLKGVGEFEGVPVAAWIVPILRYARKQGWKGKVSEGYRTDRQQAGIYNSGVRPAAKPKSMGGGGSNHSFKGYPGGAIDVSDAESLNRIIRRSPYRNLLVYAGAKDPVHFSHPHNGSY